MNFTLHPIFDDDQSKVENNKKKTIIGTRFLFLLGSLSTLAIFLKSALFPKTMYFYLQKETAVDGTFVVRNTIEGIIGKSIDTYDGNEDRLHGDHTAPTEGDGLFWLGSSLKQLKSFLILSLNGPTELFMILSQTSIPLSIHRQIYVL